MYLRSVLGRALFRTCGREKDASKALQLLEELEQSPVRDLSCGFSVAAVAGRAEGRQEEAYR